MSGMDRALERLLLALRELEAEGLPRVRDGVVHAQAFALRLHLRGQGVVGRAHVRVLRVRGHRRDDLRREHRVASRRILEGRVGVPEAVAERVHAPPVVGLHDLAVLVEVRDVAEGLVAEAVLLERADPQSWCGARRPAAGRSRAARRRRRAGRGRRARRTRPCRPGSARGSPRRGPGADRWGSPRRRTWDGAGGTSIPWRRPPGSGQRDQRVLPRG